MSKLEFIESLKNKKYSENEINELIDNYDMLKKQFPDITYQEWYDNTLKTQNRIDNRSDDIITID